MQITCCFDGLSIVTEYILGLEGRMQLDTFLPSGCVASVCNVTLGATPTVGTTTPTVGGGASLIIAMPVAVVMSLLLALVAIL